MFDNMLLRLDAAPHCSGRNVSVSRPSRLWTSRSAARTRGRIGARTNLLSAAASVAFCLAASPPSAALAQNECGPPPPGGGTVTCEPSENPYPGGIDYDPPGGLPADLTLVLSPGVVVANQGSPSNPNGVAMSSATPGVDLVLQAGNDTRISTSFAGADGVDVVSTRGTVSVTVDNVSTASTNSRGIFAASTAGNVSVTSNAVVTSGDASAGIRAETDGSVTIVSGSVTTAGAGDNLLAQAADGILAIGGTISITSESVRTSGRDASGIRASGGSGGVTITSESVVTEGPGDSGGTGFGAAGINVTSQTGNILIRSGSVTSAGSSADGIAAIFIGGGAETVFIASETISTAGTTSYGIRVREFSRRLPNGPPGVTIESGSISTLGEGSVGIAVDTPTSNISIASDRISTLGAGAFGIFAFTEAGGVAIVNTGLIDTSGSGASAILAFTTEGGAVSVDSAEVATRGDDSSAILASGVDGTTVTSGSVTTGGARAPGIDATSANGNVAVVSGSVQTSGASSPGIFAGAGGSGSITLTSDAVTTGGRLSGGITAIGESGDVTIDSKSVVTRGDGSVGLTVDTEGDIAITSGSIVTSGGTAPVVNGPFALASSGGISVVGAGTIGIDSALVETSGESANGINIAAGSGPLTLSSGSITTRGEFARGILTTSYGRGTVSIDSGSIATSGDDAVGIDILFGEGRSGNIDIASGSIATSGRDSPGIQVFEEDLSTFLLTGPPGPRPIITIDSGVIATSAAGSIGIFLNPLLADLSVTSGRITTSGAGAVGILAFSSADVLFATAPNPEGGTSAIQIRNTELVQTTGPDAPGIVALTRGPVVIESARIITTGDGSTAITASGGTGVSVNSTSITTSGAGAAGIDVSSTGDIAIVSGSVRTAGTGSSGIVAVSTAGRASVDSGDVEVAGPGSDAIAITSATGSSVTARGLIASADGLALQIDGGSAAVNIGAGGTVRGRIDLTPGADMLVNAGLFDAIGTSSFHGGADSFVNSGTIRAVNGAVSLSGLETFTNAGRIGMADGAADDRLTIEGSFNGQTGSRLVVDVDFGARTSDVLFTGVATGTTIIEARPAGAPGQSGFSSVAILVVDAAPGTQGTAFSLAGGSTGNGYVTSGLIFDAATFNFLLANSPNQPVFETALVAEMLAESWYQSADAVWAQLDSARDNDETGGGAEGGGGSRRHFGGWVQLLAGERRREALQNFGATIFDVGYELNFEGFQAGFDRQAGPVQFGLTFGFGQSDAEFVASSNRLETESRNLGAYAAFHAGGFFLNALVKADWIDLETQPGAGLGADFSATSYGVRGAAGFRFDLGPLFAEPSVGLSWVTTDVDDYTSGGATISFEDGTSVQGTAGLRIGAAFETSGASLISPFAGIRMVEELSGGNRNQFLLGSVLSLSQGAPGTHGEAAAGIDFRSRRLDAFLRAELDFGGDVEGHTVRAGLRLRF